MGSSKEDNLGRVKKTTGYSHILVVTGTSDGSLGDRSICMDPRPLQQPIFFSASLCVIADELRCIERKRVMKNKHESLKRRV